jgi:hypothetical protein
MKKINNYIIEKLHLNKDIKVNLNNKISYDDWFDYLSSKGVKIIKNNDTIYSLCLKKGTKKVRNEKDITYPWTDIELDLNNNQWNAYAYEDGKFPIYGDDEDKDKILIELKEFDRNKNNPRGNYYTLNNADLLINSLNELYERIR